MNIDYIAGFFDGEGCVTASMHRGSTSVNATAQVKVSASQMKPEVIHMIKDFWGVGYIIQDPNGLWRWLVGSSKECLETLSELWPHLIVKKEVAVVGVNPLTRIVYRMGTVRGNVPTPEENQIRNALVDQIHALNVRQSRKIVHPDRGA